MKQFSSSSSSVQDCYSRSDDFLEEYDPYIYAQARRHTYNRRKMLHPDVLDMEVDELAQRARIKLWLAKQKEHIVNPKAYISRVVHNESVTVIRQFRLTVSLSVDENDEMYVGEIIDDSGSLDPLYEVEQKETITYYMDEIISAVASLPDRQQQAMLCSIKERVDDLLAWTEVCRRYNLDIGAAQWPAREDELRSTRSSVTPARKKLRQRVQEAMSAVEG